jgi:hypothetical protein
MAVAKIAVAKMAAAAAAAAPPPFDKNKHKQSKSFPRFPSI